MIKKPFIVHSEITNEIYVICGAEKYPVTEQVIKAMQNTGRLEQQPSEDCVSRQAVKEAIMKCEEPCDDDLDFYIESTIQLESLIDNLPPVTPTHGTCKGCSHYDPLTCNSGTCLNPNMQWSNEVSATHYCTDFEKRGNKNESIRL